MNRGFQRLGEGLDGQLHGTQDLSGENTDPYGSSIPLNTVVAETLPRGEDPGDAQIVVKKEFHISVGGSAHRLKS